MKALYKPGLQFYVDKLNSGKKFAFVRYGDADWSTITEHQQQAEFGGAVHQLDLPGLRAGMIQSICEAPDTDNYYLPTRTGVRKAGTVQYFAFLLWLMANRLGEIDWHDCNVFAEASKSGKLWPFIEALRGLDVPRVVVGPPWMRKLRAFPIDYFIAIPEYDCWLEFDRILAACLDVPGPVLYSLSAGVAAKALAWNLYQHQADSWILDLGSLWDPFVGVQSRSYHRAITRDVIKSNLGGGRRD